MSSDENAEVMRLRDAVAELECAHANAVHDADVLRERADRVGAAIAENTNLRALVRRVGHARGMSLSAAIRECAEMTAPYPLCKLCGRQMDTGIADAEDTGGDCVACMRIVEQETAPHADPR